MEIDRELLINSGIDINGGIARFCGDENMYFGFLKSFVEDETYNKLIEVVNNRDIEQAYYYAHTLKGITGNLSINNLYGITSQLSKKYKEKLFDEDSEVLFQELKCAYSATVGTIKKATI